MKRVFFEALKMLISALTVWLIFVAHPLGYSSFLILTIGLGMVAAVLLLEACFTDDCGEVCVKGGRKACKAKDYPPRPTPPKEE